MSSADEDAPRQCPECGQPMIEPICPACLMRRGFMPSTSEALASDLPLTVSTDQPAVSDPDAQTTSDAELAAGKRFGDYQIVGRLGRGGMGTVYEADHLPTGRRVALKLLTHSLDNPQARARFLREGRLAASINHPNSVYVYGTEQIGDTPSISMELIRGGTLQQWVQARGSLPVESAVDAVLQIIDGLEAADRKGVLHRDVKPANCFIDPSGTIKIGDFGLSISTEARPDQSIGNVTCEGVFLGTPAFASPEQLRGEPLDRRSDIYAVGVTLFYLLTGETPFSGENMVQLLATVLDKQPPALRTLRPTAPQELEDLLRKCLQKSPGQRFASYDALREALMPLSSQRQAPAPLGNRLFANVIDIALLSLTSMTISYSIQLIVYGELSLMPRFDASRSWSNVAMSVGYLSCMMIYYLIGEWRWGTTIGKHLFRFRVVSKDGRLTLGQAFARSSLFVAIPNLPSVVFSIHYRDLTFAELQQSPLTWIGMLVGLSYYCLKGSLFLTARPANGFAAIHDLVSGSRVISRPALTAAALPEDEPETFDAASSNVRIGPYHVLRPLWGDVNDGLILAYDAKLLRRVWLRTVPPSTPEVDRQSRNLARRNRLRWLGGRRGESENWDCYEALSGRPFANAVEDDLPWPGTVAALCQLAQELNTASDEGSLPPGLDGRRLWITDDGTLKLLPFPATKTAEKNSALGAATDAAAGPTAGDDSSETPVSPLAFLQQSVRFAAARTSRADDSRPASGISLSAQDALVDVAKMTSLSDAYRQLTRIADQPTINVRRRRQSMVALSLAVPTFLFFSSLIVSVAMEQQKEKMPRVAELGKLATELEIESRIHHKDQKRRVAAIESWIAVEYRDVIEDQEKMSSLYSLIVIPQPRRAKLNDVLKRPPLTEAEAVKVESEYKALAAEGNRSTVPADIGFFSFPGIFAVATFAWMELIWVPSLFTAIFFRGGAMLWMFGLTLANRHGQRASRLRVFLRMFSGGILPLIISTSLFSVSVLTGNYQSIIQFALATLIVLFALFALLGPGRMIHDRLTGTYPVAR